MAIVVVGGFGLLWWKLDVIACYLGVPSNEKLDIVRVYLLGVGGGLLIWQISVANRRATSAERVATLAALGNITDRFHSAIANLGSTDYLIRIGGYHQLNHIARDAPDYRETVLGLLQARLSRISGSVSDLSQLSPDLSVEYETVYRFIGRWRGAGGVFYEEDTEDGN